MIFENKSDVDKHFKDNWQMTPVQYDGANFDRAPNMAWVSISLLPYDRELIGMDGHKGRKLDYAYIRVNCYDTSATLCYNLANEVQKFLECTDIPTAGNPLMVGLGIADGNGAIPLDDGIYFTQLNFITKKDN